MKKYSSLASLFSVLSFLSINAFGNANNVEEPERIPLDTPISVTLSGVFEQKNFYIVTNKDGYLVCKVSQTNPNGTYGAYFFLNWEEGCCGYLIGSNISGTDFNQFIGNSAGAGRYNITLQNGSGGENTITFKIILDSTRKKNDFEPDDTYENANLIALNSTKTGHINFVDPSNRNLDAIDIYKMNVETAGDLKLKLNLTPSSYQTEYNLAWITLLDSNLNFLIEDSSLQNATIKYKNLPKGLYYIRVIARLDRPSNPYIYGNEYKLSNTFFTPPSMSITNKSILEGDTDTKQLKFTITLSNAYSDTIKVKYKTRYNTAKAGSDFIAASGTLLFKPGETTKKISITINGDIKPEPDEKFYMILSNPVNATIANDTAFGTIRNDDGSALSNEYVENAQIKSNSFASNFKAHPNPVREILYVESKANADFYLADVSGKRLITKQISGKSSIDVSKLSAGIYFLGNDLTNEVQKIIVEK